MKRIKMTVLIGLNVVFCCASFGAMQDCANPIELKLNHSHKMRFCEIPEAVGVSIGSENGEADEKPVVSRDFDSFHMAQFEVTQGQYRAVMKETPWYRHVGSGVVIGTNNPAVGMLYRRAKEFAERVDRLDENATYRLPTESEWEYAARGKANQTAKYHWGDEFDPKMAFYRLNSNRNGQDVTTCPDANLVSGYCANDYGLMHMLGNVWEWTLDKYANHNPLRTDGHTAVQASAEGDTAIVKGSAFDDSSDRLRSANRFGFWDGSTRNVGFRLVRIENY